MLPRSSRLAVAAIAISAGAGAHAPAASAHISGYCGHAQTIGFSWISIYDGYVNEAFASSGTIRLYHHEHVYSHYYRKNPTYFFNFRHKQLSRCGLKKQILTAPNPETTPTGPDLGDVEPVWVEDGVPEGPPVKLAVRGITGREINPADPVRALAALRAAGYDVKVYVTARSRTRPPTGGPPRAGFRDVALPARAEPPAGDCVIGIYTRKFRAVDPSAPSRTLSMEVASRRTSKRLGHGC